MMRSVVDVSMLLFLALATVRSADGFSSGAGACPPNNPAVAGPHLINPTVVSFQDASYSFLVNGMDSASMQLVRGETYTLTVRSTGNPFRGALIRVEGSGMIEAGDIFTQIASVCDIGVTHIDSLDKTELSGIYFVPEDAAETSTSFDLTVVEANNAIDGSIYSYQRVTLDVIDPPSEVDPTTNPTSRPIPAPVAPPVPAPVAPPVPAPVAPPVPAPVAPIPAPVAPPVPAPVAPIPAPVAPPIPAQIVLAPFSAPFSVQVPTPVSAPLPAPFAVQLPTPVSAPSLAPVAAMPMSMPTPGPITAPISAPVSAPVVPPVSAPLAALPPPDSPTTMAPFPTVGFQPTTIAPFPTIPIAWLPTTAAPVRMPSMFDLPTIPISWTPPTANSIEITGTNETDGMGDNSTGIMMNTTDLVDDQPSLVFNDTDDMMGHNSTDMGPPTDFFSPEAVESSTNGRMGSLLLSFSAICLGTAVVSL